MKPIKTKILSLALIALLAVGFGLASGLDLEVVRKASEAITAIALPAPPPPREQIVPPTAPTQKASGKASRSPRSCGNGSM